MNLRALPCPAGYLQGVQVVLEALVLREEVSEAVLGLLELGLQLGLQLPAALLELQQLLLGLLEAVGQQGSVLSPERNRRGPLGPQREPQILNYI